MCIRDRFLEGYLDACGHALTPKEIEVLPLGAKIITAEPVSYTHLDVYKRQVLATPVEPLMTRPGVLRGMRFPKMNRNSS